MLYQSGKNISTHNDAIYKGTFTHNGILLKVEDNSFTAGYAQCLSPNGKSGASVKFGNGVFFDASGKNNIVYAGAPTVTGAVPVFAGLMAREPGIASSSPVANDEVAPQQNGLLIKEGFILYKHGDVFYGSGVKLTDVPLYGKVFVNYNVFVRKSNGSIYFAPKAADVESEGDIRIGKVVLTSPDDQSVTILISPLYLPDTGSVLGDTPSVTVDGATDNTLNATVQIDMPATVVLEYKTTALGVFKRLPESYVAEYDSEKKHYFVRETITNLKPGTEYTVKAIAVTAGGGKEAEGTGTTTGA